MFTTEQWLKFRSPGPMIFHVLKTAAQQKVQDDPRGGTSFLDAFEFVVAMWLRQNGNDLAAYDDLRVRLVQATEDLKQKAAAAKAKKKGRSR